MPAVTADTLTLPRLTEPGPDAVERPVRVDHHRPHRVRGRGLPGPAGLRRRPHRGLDPFIHIDQMGAVEYAPGEPRGTDWHPHRGFETVTYMHRRHLPAPGLPRRRRRHHRRRHPVDDGGRRHPAHRDAAGGAGRERRPVPRPAAVGEPARQGQDDHAPRYQNLEGEQRHAAVVARRRRAACGSSPATSTATPARVRPTRRSPSSTPRSRRAPSSTCRGSPTSTPWCTCSAGHGHVGPEADPIGAGQLAVFGAGDHPQADGRRRRRRSPTSR